MTTLLSLPDDVLRAILKDLSVPDLASCVQVCSELTSLIESDHLLQYRVELEVHGMLDMPRSTLPLADRIARLRQHGRNLCLSRFSCDNFAPVFDKEMFLATRPISDGSIAYYIRSARGTAFTVKELPSLSRSLRKVEWAAVLPFTAKKDILAVDTSQDLSVMIENDTSDTFVHFLSVELQGAPHPNAGKASINLCELTTREYEFACYHTHAVHIVGTYVSWVVPGDTYPDEGNEPQRSIVMVWDWKAGRLAWQFFTYTPTYALLPDPYILALSRDGDHESLCIYDLRADRHPQHGGPASSQSAATLPVCKLRLPSLKRGALHVSHMESCVPAPPRRHSPPFVRDPACSGVLMTMAGPSDDDGSKCTLVAVVPYRTLRDVISSSESEAQGRRKSPAGASTGSSSASAGPSSSTSHPVQRQERTFEWDEWGPDGMLLINLEPTLPSPPAGTEPAANQWFSANIWPDIYGARLSLLFCDNKRRRSGYVLTWDVSPWAARLARRYRPADSASPDSSDSDSDWGSPRDLDLDDLAGGPPRSFLDALMTLPSNVLSRPSTVPHAILQGPRVVFPREHRPFRIMASHDGFALAYEPRGTDPCVTGIQSFTV